MRWLLFSALVLLAAFPGCRSGTETPEPPVGLERGNRAPALEGIDSGGEPFALEGVGQPQVIVFYSSAACGLCRVRLENLQAHLSAYEREGARVIAVTLDAPEASRTYRDQAGIGYPLVSADSATFLTWAPADSALGAPLPATYILDGSGIVQFGHIGRNASDRMSDAAIISILSDLKRP